MKNMKTYKFLIIIIILALIGGNIYLGYKYFNVQKELRQAQTVLEIQKTNEKVLDFNKLFIEKVLKAEEKIDFEERLKLENMVRNLNDEEILIQWQKFTESKTETEAQDNVKDLLYILVNKTEVKL